MVFYYESSNGPYSAQVEHVLHILNGKYLKGLEQMNVKPFEPIELKYDKAKEVSEYVRKNLSDKQIQILKNLINLIDSFQSPLSLEILATIDFIRLEIPDANKDDIIRIIKNWSYRKQEHFDEKYIDIALEHLDEYKSQLQFV